MRVVSLLPAATEIVAALGLMDALVGVSHECDFPAEVATKPRVTQCAIHGNALPSGEIDAGCRRSSNAAARSTRWTSRCCASWRPTSSSPSASATSAPSATDSVTAFAATLPGPPRGREPRAARLADVFDDVRRVGAALGVADRAGPLVAELEARIAPCESG